MRSRTLLALSTAVLMAVAGCSSDEDGDSSPPPPPDPCIVTDPGAPVPVQCVPGGEDDAPIPTPSGPPPAEGSSFYDALKVEPIVGELARGGNDTDVSKTTQSFTVTVDAGFRLGSQAVCEGRTLVVIETQPDSLAANEFACGFDGAPAELIVEEPELATATRTYRVTVTVPAPARWYAVLYQTDEPLTDPNAA